MFWCFFIKLFYKTITNQQIKIGQSVCKDVIYPFSQTSSYKRTLESFKVERENIFPESGHILFLNDKNILIRLSKLYLVPTGTQVHTFHKQAINEGDTLVTLAYERLKASDIIQGLPKAEQLLEARVGNQVLINLYIRFEILVAHIKERLWNYIESLTQMDLMLSQISVNRAHKALEYSQLETVDQVQKVYLSQGVYISDKHFEVIVRQMSCKIAIVENSDFTAFSPKGVIRTAFPYDTLGVFFPGELLEISKAQRMNRVLYKPLPCKPILLGITQASLNANSFLSEASFERTITVLSRSALQGRIDWLKGLKENVLLSKMIPAGTGLQQDCFQTLFSTNQQKSLKKKNNWKFFYKTQSLVCLYKPFFSKRNWLHKSLKQLTEQSLNSETKKFYLQQLTNSFLPIKKENIFFLFNSKGLKLYSYSLKEIHKLNLK
jgi:DNA-directed RNA polymerase subunit beta'